MISAWFDPGTGVVRGEVRRARSRKAGKHLAAVSLLAVLTGLPEPDVRLPDEPEPDKPAAQAGATAGGADNRRTNALMDLNQLKLDEVITKPEWTYESIGTPQKPQFLCTGRCEVLGQTVRADGRGRSKSDARMAAADALLSSIHHHRAEAAEALVAPSAPVGADRQAVGEQHLVQAGALVVPGQRTAETVNVSGTSAVAEALAAGCALTLIRSDDSGDTRFLLYRDDGAAMPAAVLPAPMAEAVQDLALACGPPRGGPWWSAGRFPLRSLSRRCSPLTSPAESCTSRRPPGTAVLRFGLELLAARMVHPAVGDNGTGVWRFGPVTGPHRTVLDRLVEDLPPHAHCQLLPADDAKTLHMRSADDAVDTALTALADTFVATPGGSALFGAHPYTTVAQRLHRDLAQWADDLEERADPGPPPRLVLAIEAPTEADAAAQQLRATLLIQRTGGTEPPVPADSLWSDPGPGTVVLRRRIQRVLRRCAAAWPAAERLAAQPQPAGMRLSVAEVAHLATLGADGVPNLQVHWPAGLIDALTGSPTTLRPGLSRGGQFTPY